MRYIKNRLGRIAFEGNPWEIDLPDFVPEKYYDRVVRDKWIKDDKTDHVVYSAVIGQEQSVRCSKENPIYAVSAIVADYDSAISADEVVAGIGRCKTWVPTKWEKTLSKNARMIWEFEQPVLICSESHYQAFVEVASKALNLRKLFPGFDTDAYKNPYLYYTTSGDWYQVSGSKPIDSNTLEGWQVQAAAAYDWGKLGTTDIPLADVAKAIEEKYPGKWHGDFVPGARSTRFWDAMSDNDTSAILREGGFQCYTGPKPFVSWANLLGTNWVENYRTLRVGAAVQDIWFDGEKYWMIDATKLWFAYSKESVKLLLRSKGISNRALIPGTLSELDQCIVYIEQQKTILGAAPILFAPQGVISQYGEGRKLNISTKKVLSPAEELTPWGEKGKFPWISEYLDGIFSDPPEQLKFFLGWLKRFYESAYEERLVQGHAIFIAGEPSAGKSLLSTYILSNVFRGHAPAERYLQGDTRFNQDVFQSALWTVDDTTSNSSFDKKLYYSAMVKKMAANNTFVYEPKFKNACKIDWSGRLVITMNLDPHSIQMLPDIEGSILDKIMLLKASTPKIPFPTEKVIQQLVHQELPYFLRWLLEWPLPDDIVGANRYGIKEYRHPELFTTAQAASSTSIAHEVLYTWGKMFFKSTKEPGWIGSCTELYSQISGMQVGLEKMVTIQKLGITLGKLESAHHQGIRSHISCGRRVYSIYRNFIPLEETMGLDPEGRPYEYSENNAF